VNDDISVLRTAVADLVPAFQARAAEAERLRTMPADLVLRAKQAGLFRLNLPRSLGGYELEPAVTVEIFEEISRADARLAGRWSSATARPSSPGWSLRWPKS
jgi:alkylation response protein AidB-like acyl-CoA dehydrogenase